MRKTMVVIAIMIVLMSLLIPTTAMAQSCGAALGNAALTGYSIWAWTAGPVVGIPFTLANLILGASIGYAAHDLGDCSGVRLPTAVPPSGWGMRLG